MAFLATVDRLSVPLAGSSSPPALGCSAAFGTTVSRLGKTGTKGFLAALEQTEPLPGPTCPLTGSRLAASLMWAQGSCELPTAKPRTRRLLLRSEAPYLPTLVCTESPIQTTIAQIGFQGKRRDTKQLPTTNSSLVPTWLLKWYPHRLLPTLSAATQAIAIKNYHSSPAEQSVRRAVVR